MNATIDYFTDKMFGYELKSDNLLWNVFSDWTLK